MNNIKRDGNGQPVHPMAKSNLSMLQKIMYAMGNMGGNFLNLLFTMWITKFYCPPTGEGMKLLNISWVTNAILAGRVVDGIADPPVGYLSDRARTRWGRRIPFILFGGLPLCIVFFLLWAPPTGIFKPESKQLFAYFVGLMAIYWILFTVVLCPYLGLLPEIVSSKAERVDLSTYMGLCLMIGTVLAGITAPVIIDKWGFKAMGAIFASLSVICIYATPLAIREKPLGPRTPEENYGFFTAFKWTFSNRPFIIYVISSVFIQLGFNVVIVSIPFIVTVLLGKTNSFAAVLFGINGLGTLLSFVPMNILSKRIGKKKMYLVSMLAMGLLLPLIYLLGQVELPFDFLTFTYGVFFFIGFPVAAIMVLPNAILADIVDHDEKLTGRRREAMYFGMQGILFKFAVGLASKIQGFLFDTYGYEKAKHLGINLLGPVAGALVLLGFVVFLFYPIDDRKPRN